MKLKQEMLNSLALPEGKTDVIYFDDDQPGLGLRLRASGARTFVVQYQYGPKKNRRISLGMLPLGVARKTAGEIMARVRLGEDPAATKAEAHRRAAETVEAALRSYLPMKEKEVRSGSYKQIAWHLLSNAKSLHEMPIIEVTRRDIGNLLAPMAASKSSATTNNFRNSLHAFFHWAVARGLIEHNPVAGTYSIPEKRRERSPSLDELVAIWKVCEDDFCPLDDPEKVPDSMAFATVKPVQHAQFGDIVKLLILTGQRCDEIGGLEVEEISDGVITLPPRRTKNHRKHTIPLSGPAQQIISARLGKVNGRYVFRGGRGGLDMPFVSWSHFKRILDERLVAASAKLEPWRFHDIRHSISTGMNGIGIQPHIVEAVINHVSGFKAGVAGRYNHFAYETEKRQALNMWAEHVMAAVEGRDQKVVPLARCA
jgi:integrase